MTTPITRGAAVRHKVHVHRGLGRVLTIGRTLLRSQAPKVHVAFERGSPIWCYPDDLVLAPAIPPVVGRPLLSVVEPVAPEVA